MRGSMAQIHPWRYDQDASWVLANQPGATLDDAALDDAAFDDAAFDESSSEDSCRSWGRPVENGAA
jgi:hypothetical protein